MKKEEKDRLRDMPSRDLLKELIEKEKELMTAEIETRSKGKGYGRQTYTGGKKYDVKQIKNILQLLRRF